MHYHNYPAVRGAYVQRKVLDVYRQLPSLSYPFYVGDLMPLLPIPSRMMSYQEMAQTSSSNVSDVARMCGSEDGATHIDRKRGRALILYNADRPNGRILWTQTHEMAHLFLGHTADTTGGSEAINIESEADFFVWNLLAPLPILRAMGIQSDIEIMVWFGLSEQASAIHLKRYRKWCAGHIKTAWENDMLRIFREKYGV